MNTGMTPEAAVQDKIYKEQSVLYFEYLKAKITATVDIIKQGVIPEETNKCTEYLKKIGIETVGDSVSEDWLYHLVLIQEMCPHIKAIKRSMSMLVKCTHAELEELLDGNTEYGLIFYASDIAGAYYVTSEKPDYGSIVRSSVTKEQGICSFTTKHSPKTT